jgi:alpha-D-ribose 1-methylphosphonate 5-triphosphate synthase subunit PhnH
MLLALSAPGRELKGLPAVALGALPSGIGAQPNRDVQGHAAALLLALADETLTLAAIGDGATESVAATVAGITGATLLEHGEDPSRADLLIVGGEESASAMGMARRGTAVEPHRGATVILAGHWPERVYAVVRAREARAPSSSASRTASMRLPEGARLVIAEANANYPAGLDLLVATDHGFVALPRGWRIEELAAPVSEPAETETVPAGPLQPGSDPVAVTR